MAHARRVRSLFAVCVPADEALAIREDVAFIEAVRASIAKIEGAVREGADIEAELDVAVRQIVSELRGGAAGHRDRGGPAFHGFADAWLRQSVSARGRQCRRDE